VKPWLVRVQEAICSDPALTADQRHLLMTMALVADCRTAKGWHSQATLAGLTKRSERYVRDLLADLASRKDGVRITRRRRPAADGRGRGSDEWTLWVPEVQPAQRAGSDDADQPARAAGRNHATNRHANPVEASSTGTPRRFNRHAESFQPAQRAGDPGSDPLSDPQSTTIIAEALDLPLLERAQLTFSAEQGGDPHRAQATCPHEWPELQDLAEHFRRVTGLEHVQAGPWPNANTKRLVELLAVPHLPSTIKQAFDALPGSTWWEQPDKRRLGLAGLSPRVVEGLLTERVGRPKDSTRALLRRVRDAGGPAALANVLPAFGGKE
jgi:hypothetical protein